MHPRRIKWLCRFAPTRFGGPAPRVCRFAPILWSLFKGSRKMVVQVCTHDSEPASRVVVQVCTHRTRSYRVKGMRALSHGGRASMHPPALRSAPMVVQVCTLGTGSHKEQRAYRIGIKWLCRLHPHSIFCSGGRAGLHPRDRGPTKVSLGRPRRRMGFS